MSVVVPLFNEEENVPILQAELAAALAGLDYEIIFVDDGSTDATACAHRARSARAHAFRSHEMPAKARPCMRDCMRRAARPRF